MYYHCEHRSGCRSRSGYTARTEYCSSFHAVLDGRDHVETELDRLRSALADRYDIERQIGSGGAASVYLATDLRHARPVAIKVLRPDISATLGPERFFQEIRITANLQHPHILPLFDSGEADGLLYYVMPYAEGETLKDRLGREGGHGLPIEDAARLTRDVIDALAAAHRAGVVHRDIKPSNVLISGRHAVVADFGVAKALSEVAGTFNLTTIGTALGTPAYMSPEQAAADEAIDHRSDIYSVGAMAYELFSGRPPFTGSSHQQVLTAHITKAPDPIAERRASIPPGLAAAIMRCLEKKPADRWQSAEELLPHFDSAITPSLGTTPVVMKPPRRRSWGGWVKALVPLAAVVIGIVAWQAWAGTRVDAPPGPPAVDRILIAPPEARGSVADLDFLIDQISDAMRRRIGQYSSVDVVSGPRATAAARESGADGSLDVLAMADATDATYLFVSQFSATEGSITFTLEVLDAVTGESLRLLEPMTASRDATGDLVAAAGDQAAVAAMALLLEEHERHLRFSSLPRNPEAFRLFERSAGSFNEGRHGDAANWAFEAIRLEPTWPAAYLIVRPALNNAGRGSEFAALDSAFQAVRPNMTRNEQLFLTWLAGPTLDDRITAGIEMFELEKGKGQTPYMVAFRSIGRNRLHLAREAMDVQNFEHSSIRQWAYAWWLDDKLHHLLGNYREELIRARDGRARFPDDVRLARDEARALVGLDSIDDALRVFRSIPEIAVDASEVWEAMRDVVLEFGVHGYLPEYEEAGDAFLAWSIETEGVTRFELAQAYYHAQEYEAAVPLLEADAIASEGTARLARLGPLVISLDRLGLDAEAAEYASGLDDFPPTSRSMFRLWPAAVVASRGDAVTAVRLLIEAFDADVAYYTWLNDFMHTSMEFGPIRDDPQFVQLMTPPAN
jgi:tetratricopeptide (TPR) repeat protein